MTETFVRTISADLPSLGGLLDDLAAHLAARGIAERPAYAVQLVCEELVANTIRHGRARDPLRRPTVEVAVRLGLPIEIRIDDDAEPFDPTRIPEPPIATDLDDASVGGRGIRLVRAATSRFTWRLSGGRNCVEATVSVSAPAS